MVQTASGHHLQQWTHDLRCISKQDADTVLGWAAAKWADLMQTLEEQWIRAQTSGRRVVSTGELWAGDGIDVQKVHGSKHVTLSTQPEAK